MRWRVRALVLGPVALLVLRWGSGCCGTCKLPGYTPAHAATSTPTPSPVVGMVDLHAHVFATAAFGGRWHWGSVEGAEDVALMPCDGSPKTHANAGGKLFSEMLGELPGITWGDTGYHLKRKCGYPSYTGWPRWDTVAHMQYWEGHLKKALDDGLTVMVVQAVDSLAMCQMVEKHVTHPAAKSVYACGDGDSFESLKGQIQLAKEFDASHDWVEIAYSPADARRILDDAKKTGQKKMVWVLGIEADYMWGNAKDSIDLEVRLKQYHQLGVRAMFLAHHVNTRLAGAAIFFEPVKTIQWMANCFFLDSNCGGGANHQKYHLKARWCLFHSTAQDYGDVCDLQLGMWVGKKDGFAEYPGGVDWVQEGQETVEKNHIGLTDDGRKIVKEMMDLGVLVDLAHLSEKGVGEVAAIAAQHNGYPLFASHAYFRERMLGSKADVKAMDHFYNKSHEAALSTATVKLIADSGGMVGHFMGPDPESQYDASGVDDDCYGSTKSLAQGLAWGVDQGVSVGFATDFMGMARGLAPRGPGDGQCLGIGWQQKKQKGTLAAELDDFNRNGLGHVGLIGAAVKDLENVGLNSKYLKHVRDAAAENFIRMWEKAEKARTP